MGRKHYIPFTDEMRRNLLFLKKETGCAAIALYNYMLSTDRIPKNSPITNKRIDSWMSGIVKSVKPKDYNAVIAAYEAVLSEVDSPHSIAKSRVPVTPELKVQIVTLRERAKNSGVAMLLKRTDAPKGLSANILSHAVNGRLTTIRKDHYLHIKHLLEMF